MNLSDIRELNPIIHGATLNAIFGFYDIETSFTTEGLQQDVMISVKRLPRSHTGA